MGSLSTSHSWPSSTPYWPFPVTIRTKCRREFSASWEQEWKNALVLRFGQLANCVVCSAFSQLRVSSSRVVADAAPRCSSRPWLVHQNSWALEYPPAPSANIAIWPLASFAASAFDTLQMLESDSLACPDSDEQEQVRPLHPHHFEYRHVSWF